MSDTPRTDRAVAFDDDGEMVASSFARSLERELADMTAFRDSEARCAEQYKQERDEAIKERDDAIEYLGVCMKKLEFGSTEGDQ